MHPLSEGFDDVERVTGMSEKEIQQLLHWWVRLPFSEQYKAFGAAVGQHFRLKEKEPHLNLRMSMFCGLLLSLKSARPKYKPDSGTRQEPVPVPVPETKRRAISRKRRAVLAFIGDIQGWVAEGRTVREVAQLLGKKHRVKISHSYLFVILTEEGIMQRRRLL